MLATPRQHASAIVRTNKGTRMDTKTRKAAISLIRHAYAALEPLNNIKWTAYRDRCFDLSLAEEKQHRTPIPMFGSRPSWGITQTDAARLFVCKRIADELCNPRTKIADVLHYQPSAIYAASIVANHADVIRAVWAPETIEALRAFDYAALVETNEVAA